MSDGKQNPIQTNPLRRFGNPLPTSSPHRHSVICLSEVIMIIWAFNSGCIAVFVAVSSCCHLPSVYPLKCCHPFNKSHSDRKINTIKQLHLRNSLQPTKPQHTSVHNRWKLIGFYLCKPIYCFCCFFLVRSSNFKTVIMSTGINDRLFLYKIHMSTACIDLFHYRASISNGIEGRKPLVNILTLVLMGSFFSIASLWCALKYVVLLTMRGNNDSDVMWLL